MKNKKYFTVRIIIIILLVYCELMNAQQLKYEFGSRIILFETNNGCQNLISTTKKVFVSYFLPAKFVNGSFFESRKMIVEEFMAGINFSADSAVLTIEQYWNGIKVQQCIITPALYGAPTFAARQNRPLLIRTQIRRESGLVSKATLRNHSYWQTDFEKTNFFGRGDEYTWGNIAIDLRQDVLVEWKYFWSIEGCHFYFDHLKVDA